MTLENFITTYGYLAVALGTFFEGETVLILAGFAARRGYLELPWVIVAALAGSLAGDQLYFFLGRWQRGKFLTKRPSWQAKIGRAHRLLESHHNLVIIGFRFIYGIRTVVPFVIGTSKVPASRFILLNVAGAFLWSILIGSAGFIFGQVAQAVIGDIKHMERKLMIVIAAIGLAAWLIHLYRRRVTHREV